MNGGSSNNSSGKSTNLPLIEFSHASSDSAAANGDNGGIVEQSNARSPNGIFANNFLGPEEAANMKDLALSSDNAENDSDSADEEDELFSRKTTGSGGGSGAGGGGGGGGGGRESKPLMAPRRARTSSSDSASNATVTLRMPKPFKNRRKVSRCYLFLVFLGKCAVVVSIAAVIFVTLFFLIQAVFKKSAAGSGAKSRHVSVTTLASHAACSHITVEDVWIRGYPKMGIEGPLRLLDVNSDGILDIIVPFASGVDSLTPIEANCRVYYDNYKTGYCAGGIMAVDGRDGSVIWSQFVQHEPFALTCETDLNKDGQSDCVLSGRGGLMSAHDGRTGQTIWSSKLNRGYKNYYTVQPVGDLDNDKVTDFVQIHGGDPRPTPEEKNRPKGELVLLSGATGTRIRWKYVPDKHESYYSPQVISLGEGTKAILFGTGGETIPGALYLLRLRTFLLTGEIDKARKIYSTKDKGIMTPPVLADVNRDRVHDIVMATFNGSVIAFDGVTFKKIWQTDFKHGETYSTPAPGYYNDDDVPDFFVQYSIGIGYPIYFYARYAILDGRTGEIIIELPFSSVSVITSPLTVSFEGAGHDVFLYWKKDCYRHEGQIMKNQFSYSYHQSVASHTEFCRAQFNTTYVTKLLMIGQHIKPPGILLYHSHRYFHEENQYNLDSWRRDAQRYLLNSGADRDLYDEFNSFFSQVSKLSNHQFDSTGPDAVLGGAGGGIAGFGDYGNIPDYDNSYPEYDTGANSRYALPSAALPRARPKRHIGPHDGQGSMRVISTGTLAPSLPPVGHNASSSIDVLFTIYVGAPAPSATVMTPAEAKCFADLMDKEGQRFDKNSEFYGYDTDRYRDYASKQCARHYGSVENFRKILDGLTTSSDYFGLNYLQLTLYRKRITCHCNRSQPCLHILPFEKQRWGSYLGNHADAYMRNPI
ncbi:hypothetical protein BOX15_Mlig025309g1 [Macrostomum lignano]|uniref:FAM234A/B beta-propeller domain-containing protein n=1 Tax=Macrostomum lignano TaxID=282301 RepID=A0A267FDV9_9PLAT|nr:hypothetical protein BOX15_Mlig025309g1 [Macrostomum lignano]